MTQQKRMIIALTSFVVTAVALVLLCANAHIDIFPCKETLRDFSRAPLGGEAPLVTREGTCSLMDHLRSGEIDPAEKAELTPAGWALLAVFCLGIAAADSAMIYVVLGKSGKR